jgi:hypothetical protein
MFPRVSVLTLTVAIVVPAQHRVWRVSSPLAGPSSSAVAVIGDRDGDGHADIVKPIWVPWLGSTLAPHAWTFSGATGQVLSSGPLGAGVLATAGDVNLDGCADYIMLGTGAWLPSCAPWQCTGFDARSGMDDSIVWHVDLPTMSGLGTMLLGDIDLTGDGRPDAIIGTNVEGTGHLFAVSSSGNILYHLHSQSDSLGPGVAKFIDYNGDGREDFLVGMYVAPSGAVDIRSGVDGSILRRLPAPTAVHLYGATVASIGDLDDDGIDDIVVGDSGISSPGVLSVLGSVSGLELRRWQVNAVGRDDFGWPRIGVVDVDRDGFDDVVANARAAQGISGQFVFSGRDGSQIQHYTEPDSALQGEISVLPPQLADPFPRWAAWGYYSPNRRTYMFSGAPLGVERTGMGSTGTLPCMPIIGIRTMTSGFRVTLSRAEPGAFAILVLGFSQPSVPFFDLSLLGFASSYLYPQPDALGFFQAGVTWPIAGYIQHDIARFLVPPTWPGAAPVWMQWVVFGSGAAWPGGVSEALRMYVW